MLKAPSPSPWPMPVPTAVIIVRISLFWRTLSRRAFSTLMSLPANGQDGLKLPVPALLGGAAGGVALDDVEFGIGRVAVRAVGQFAGQAAAGQRALAHGLTGLPGRLTGPGGHEGLVEHLFGHGGLASNTVISPS